MDILAKKKFIHISGACKFYMQSGKSGLTSHKKDILNVPFLFIYKVIMTEKGGSQMDDYQK